MGTEIYLIWDGMTKEQEEQQTEGFRIDGGKDGYLRASIGMEEEMTILRALFPAEVWEAGTDVELNFDEHMEKFRGLAEAYARGDVPVDRNYKVMLQEEQGRIQETYRKRGEEVELQLNAIDTKEERDTWLRSLVAFWKLGWHLQKAGKNPRVLISW